MTILPDISNKVNVRPGTYRSQTKILIPAIGQGLYWNDFYSEFNNSFKLLSPIEDFSNKINPYFGYFGYRWHPINFTPRYFHIGIDIGDAIGTPIKSVYGGYLEYSGYANINGNYVIIKHPDIKTKDGFILHSIYMHCDDINVKFNLSQKILREYISNKFKVSNIEINEGQDIATVGCTGNELGVVPHLHLQFEFIKDKKHIAIDPLELFQKKSIQNLTANFVEQSDFQSFYEKHINELSLWEKFWNTKLL